MPHINISMYEGKTPTEKEELAKKIHNAVLKELGCSPEALSLSFSEYAPDDFVSSVKSSTEDAALMISSRAIY